MKRQLGCLQSVKQLLPHWVLGMWQQMLLCGLQETICFMIAEQFNPLCHVVVGEGESCLATLTCCHKQITALVFRKCC